MKFVSLVGLELFSQLQIHEAAKIVVVRARIIGGVLELEAKCRWRALTKDIVYTHGYPGVVEQVFPARHGISN